MAYPSHQPANESQIHWAFSLKGVVIIAALYGLVHAALRLALSSAIGEDDVIANLFTQSFQWGYIAKNPPLYDWLIGALQQITGPTLLSFLLLKYTLWTMTAGFIFAASNRILEDPKWAAITVFSMTLCYQIGWNIHEGVTHTAVLCLMIAATFWSFLRLIEKPTITAYALFGLCIGLGFLSKFGFGAFLALLLIAAFVQKPIRQQLSVTGLMLSLFVACVLFAPFGLWVLHHLDDPSLSAVKAVTSTTTYWEKYLFVVMPAFYAPLEFLLPFLLVLPLAFKRFAKETIAKAEPVLETGHQEADLQKLLLHMFLLGWALLILAAILFSFSKTLARYMHPISLLFFIWLMARAKQIAEQREIERYVTVILVVLITVIGLRVANLIVAEPFCKKCRQLEPYVKLADHIRAHGFKNGGLIIGDKRYVSGNMRAQFPKSAVINQYNPTYVPPTPATTEGKQLLFVWSNSQENRRLTKQERQMGDVVIEDGDIRFHTVQIRWSHPWRANGYRSTQWQFAIIDK